MAPESFTNTDEFSQSSCYSHPVDDDVRHRIIPMERLLGVGAQLGFRPLWALGSAAEPAVLRARALFCSVAAVSSPPASLPPGL